MRAQHSPALGRLPALLALARPYHATLALGVVLLLGESAAALVVPWLGGRFAEAILRPQAGSAPTALLLAMLAVFAILALARFAATHVLEGAADRIVADLKARLYEHLQALPLEYFHQRRLGESVALLANDVYAVSTFVSGTAVAVPPLLLTAAGASLFMLAIRPDLALFAIVLVPLFYLCAKVVGRRMRPLVRRLHEEEASAIAIAEENLGMLPAIKAFTRERQEADRYRGQLASIVDLSARQRRIRAAFAPLMQFAAAAGIVLLLAAAGADLLAARLTPAELVSFLLYALLLARPVADLADVYGQAQMARGALERLDAAMREPAEDTTSGAPLRVDGGEVGFHQVSFSYRDRPAALQSIDLRIRAGETVAIVGPNGAGKSTLAHLLMRLHEPDSGRITIDATDVAAVSLASLRGQIGVVPQHVMLLNASVRDNIAYGRVGADVSAIEAAAIAARAHDFIVRLPQGYDTGIGDDGVRLSGGEQQRLALARALLKDPPILILDEATAMFDPEGEAQFLEACRDSFARRTVILITHRPASLRVADRIVHMRDGRIERIEEREARGLRLVGRD